MAPQQPPVSDSIPKQSTSSIDNNEEKVEMKRWYTFSYHNVNAYKHKIESYKMMLRKTQRMGAGRVIDIEPQTLLMTAKQAKRFQKRIEKLEDSFYEQWKEAKQEYYQKIGKEESDEEN